MNAAIREILQYVSAHPEMATREAVDSYFDQIIWSIEKAEWTRLTDQEKTNLVEQLDAERGRPPKGPLYGDNKPLS